MRNSISQISRVIFSRGLHVCSPSSPSPRIIDEFAIQNFANYHKDGHNYTKCHIAKSLVLCGFDYSTACARAVSRNYDIENVGYLTGFGSVFTNYNVDCGGFK